MKERDLMFQKDQLSIIRIHATILGILIAIVSAYNFHIQKVIQEMELEVLHEAEKINYLPINRYGYFPKDEFIMPNSNEDKGKLFHRLTFLLSKEKTNEDVLKKFNIPSDIASRAEVALGIMNVLIHRPPFPTSLWKNDSGGWSQKGPQYLLFGNVEDVKKWLEDLDEILRMSTMLRYTTSVLLSVEYKNYFRALKNRDAEKFQSIDQEYLEPLGSVDPEYIFNNFRINLNKSEEISFNTHYNINKLEKYRSSKYPAKIIAIFIITTVCIFSLSVLYPLLHSNAKRYFWLQIPCIFYVLIIMWIIGISIKIIAT